MKTEPKPSKFDSFGAFTVQLLMVAMRYIPSIASSLIFLLVTALSPFGVEGHAASRCAFELTTMGTRVGIRAMEGLPDSPASLESTLQRLSEPVRWSNDVLLRELQTPAQILFTLVPTHESARFQPETWTIFAPDLPHQSQRERAINGHVYGHAIFAQNMRGLSREWRDWQDLEQQFQDIYLPQLELLHAKYIELNTQDPLPEAELQSLVDQAESIQNIYSPKPPPVYIAAHPFEEIFADLVGALNVGDFQEYRAILAQEAVKGLSTALDPRFTLHLAQLHADRNFETTVPLEGWNIRLEKLSANDRATVLYNPTRSYLYTHYLSDPKIRNNPSHFLALVFRALAQEAILQARITHPLANDPESRNRELIQSLTAALATL